MTAAEIRSELMAVAARTRLAWRLANEAVEVIEASENPVGLDEAKKLRTQEAILFRETWKEIEEIERWIRAAT